VLNHRTTHWRLKMVTEPGSSGFASGNPSNFSDKISTAASAIENGASDGARRAQRAAHATASALSSGADHIRGASARDIAGDAMGVVKNNPGAVLLGAIALGFLLGRALPSRD